MGPPNTLVYSQNSRGVIFLKGGLDAGLLWAWAAVRGVCGDEVHSCCPAALLVPTSVGVIFSCLFLAGFAQLS